MKKVFPILTIAAIAFMAFRQTGELTIGTTLPKVDVTLLDVSGKSISLQDAMKTKGLLVMFSCNTCPYVAKNQARTKDILTYAQSSGVGVLVLNSNEAQRSTDESLDAMKDYAKQQGYNWYYAVDPESKVADAFGANRTPETFLFDGSGKLVYHGAIDDSPSDAAAVKATYLKAAIDQSKSGQDVSVKTSRSVGCVIKRKG